MESIVKFLEKGQPYFDKVSKNIYLQAIKDGFLAAMPIILSSSVFLLISTLPGVVATVGGFTLPDWWNVDVVNICNKVYRRVPRSTAPMSRCSLPTTWAPRAC